MATTNNLKYGKCVNYYEGVIVEDRGDVVTMDVKGRLGYFELSRDLFIADYPFKLGQEVGWKMCFFEQLPPDAPVEYTEGEFHEDDHTFYFEGTVCLVEDCAISIDIKNGRGFMKSPKRMFISDTEFELGQTVGWNMTKLVQISAEANEKYVSNIHNRVERAIEISNRNH